MPRRRPTPPNRRPPPGTSKPPRALPPPTASEAAFERLLAAFDEPEGPPEPAAAAEPPAAPEPAAALKSAVSLDRGTSLSVGPPPTPSPAPAGGVAGNEQAAALSRDAGFVAALFERKKEFLDRDPFATIGDADEFFTKIVGVSFEGRQDVVAGLTEGEALALVREPANPHDPNAIAVRFGPLQLGFLRREIARKVAPNIDAGDSYVAVVASVTGGGARNVGVNIHVRRRRPVQAGRLTVPRGDVAAADSVREALIGDRPLREAQVGVLARVAAGRNTLAVLGTGRGKSLCFQLPAVERALAGGSKTLVFYPLRALANDQFEALTRRLAGFGLRILRANGAIDGNERAELDEALATGGWDVILSTPEFATYHREAFERPWNRPELVVVDEAHHVFESRHRPAYGTLGALVRDLKAGQVLALTATAPDEAFREIRSALGIDAWVIDPTVRENLHVVDARGTADKSAYLSRELSRDGKAIVYCNSRVEVTKVADRLRALRGDTVAFYHAGIPSPERAAVEDLFRRGVVTVIVATSAFGEGIDLPDVRDVVLYHLNFDLTEFNQMSGRAGRDGLPARIHLLYGQKDRAINDFIIARSAPSIETLRAIYRGLRGLAPGDMLRMPYEDIARTLDIDTTDGSTVGAAIRIFEEAGLVRSGVDDDGRFVRFSEVAGKVDLTKTTRFAEGQAERDAFDRFCRLALEADVDTLETVINRPIYPDRVPLEA